MGITNSVVATFDDHAAAETAIERLAAGGFPMRKLSIVGRGYHTEEKVVGFYNTGDRVGFWGSRGAFWGGLWGLFFGGVFLTVPVIGNVVALGVFADTLVSVLEGAVIGGALGALGAALSAIGVPRDSIVRYESAVRADHFLVMAHGSAAVVGRAHDILERAGSTRIEIHQGEQAKSTGTSLVPIAL